MNFVLGQIGRTVGELINFDGHIQVLLNFLNESACVVDLLIFHSLALVNQINVAVNKVLSALLVLPLDFYIIISVETLCDSRDNRKCPC